MLEAQMRYHQASLDILKECVPLVMERIEEDLYRPTFGCPLDIHLKNTQRDIATVIEDCVLFLYNNALDMQGLFRLAGSSSKIKKLKAALNVGIADLEDYICDVHAVTGVLKLYLRELPEPLLTFELYEDWINSSKIKGTDEQVARIKELVQLLPKPNKDNLRYLVCFLAKLAEHSEENKMSASNIAIVIGPNVLWDPNDGGVNVTTTGNVSIILETLIVNCASIFPEGCDFSRQYPVENENLLHNRFDSVEQISEKKSDSKEDMSSPEHSALGNMYNDMFKKKKEKKEQPLEKKNGHSKEDLPNLDASGNSGGGGGGNIYSDMFKKLHKEKKDGHQCSAEGVAGGGMQGYYNPISAQLSDDSFTSPPTSPVGPPANPNPPYSTHRKPSNTEPPTAMMDHEDNNQSAPGHQRSVSAGNISHIDIRTQPSPTPGATPAKEKRRPAPPPPPKHPHPSLMPPKSKPPEPPKHKPPEPPSKPPPVPPASEIEDS